MNMVIIFFLYGLSFFLLGFGILTYPKKQSAFRLANTLTLVALFGLLHGINEWIDMFVVIQEPRDVIALKVARAVALPLSFLFLVIFGTMGIAEKKQRFAAIKSLPALLLVLWAVIVWASQDPWLHLDIWARYLLCIPGTLLTGYTLLLQQASFQENKYRDVRRNLKLSAAAFFLYGGFAGALVPADDFFPASVLNYPLFMEAIGLPVQVFRALCAVAVMYSIFKVLEVFDLETKEDLRQARDELEERVKRRTKELEESNQALRIEIQERKQIEEKISESEARYRDLFEHANDLIQSVDRQGRYIYVNRKWLELLGYTADEVQHITFMDVLHKDQIPHCTAVFEQVLRGDAVDQLETTFVSKDGKDVHVEGSVNAQLKEGKFLATLGIFRNVTERKEAERFIKDVLESVGEGFVVIDPDYRIVSVNRAFCQQVRMSAKEVIGRYCYEVSHNTSQPCYKQGEDCAARRTFETGEPAAAIHLHRDRDNNVLYVETNSYPMKDKSGKVVSVIETIKDITDKAILEQQLLQAQKMEAIGNLAGGIAHDFNNILTAIIGYGNLLQMYLPNDDACNEHVEEILTSAKRAAHLTQSLLAFSRKQVINPKSVSVNEIVRTVGKLLSRLIGEDIELTVTLSAEEPIILADSGQVEQALMNLATNARDSMPDGGRLTLKTETVVLDREFIRAHGYGECGKHVLLSISDTGAGIDEGIRTKIFEPFFTTKEVGKGTGLGLSIVYGIVKQHNAFIDVFSQVGQGTTFKIFFPAVSSEAEETHEEERATPEGGAETVLLAEDDEHVRTLLKHVLEDSGYQVITAVDGEDVIDKYRAGPDSIELLILDVVMPKKNGKIVYEEIRRDNPDIKILFMSGYTADIIHTKGIFDETLNFLSKPIVPQELLAKVREILDA